MNAFYKSVNSTTIPIDLTVASSAAVQIPGKGGILRVANGGLVAIAFRVGASDVAACVFPVAATPTDSYVVLPGVTELFSVPADAYVRAITATSTATVYFSRGEGI